MSSEDTPNVQDNNPPVPPDILFRTKFLLGIIVFLLCVIVVGLAYIVQENWLGDRDEIPVIARDEGGVQSKEANVTKFVVDSFSPLGPTSRTSVVTVKFSQPIADGLLSETRFEVPVVD